MNWHRFIAAVTACVLLCGMLPLQAAAATELCPLENGDFEQGHAAAWQTHPATSISAAAAYAGRYGCLLTGDGDWDNLLWQTFPVTPGKVYTLTFWYKAQAMGVSWYLFDGGKDGGRLCRGWADKESWTCVTKEFIPSCNTVCLLYRGSGSNLPESVYLDEVQVTTIPCDDHVYDNDDDADCNLCGALRTITPTTVERIHYGGAAISYDVDGVCFRFHIEADHAKINPDHSYVSGSATIYPFRNDTGYSLVRMGAIMTNKAEPFPDLEHLTNHFVNVEGLYICKSSQESLSFAVRIINIPAQGKDTLIYALPYYVYSDGNQEIVVYGDAVSRTFNELAKIS